MARRSIEKARGALPHHSEPRRPLPSGPMSPKRVFVAGASGAVGRRLVPMLLADGHEVTGTTRSPEAADRLRALGVRPVVLDVRDEATMTSAVVGAHAEVVIHQLTDLAGSTADDYPKE